MLGVLFVSISVLRVEDDDHVLDGGRKQQISIRVLRVEDDCPG